MTCIIAIKENGRVIMGADSALVNVEGEAVGFTRKVTGAGPVVIGAAGEGSILNLLVDTAWVPTRDPLKDEHAYVVNCFFPAMRERERTLGVFHDRDGLLEGELLLGVGHRLFRLPGGRACAEVADFVCAGTGGAVARGAVLAIRRFGPRTWDAEHVIKHALALTAEAQLSVLAPFDFASTSIARRESPACTF